MYKIYINETPLILSRTSTLSAYGFYAKEQVLVVRYTGKSKHLLHFIDMLEKSRRYDGVLIHSEDYQKLKTDFKSLYETIHAAGGVVKNPSNEILFIFRKGHWDLPKGKLDPRESKSAAALREVSEETGISDLILKSKICKTRHTYKQDARRILKIVTWYYMVSEGRKKPKPQQEESIEVAKWLEPGQLLESKPKMFRSIKEVLKKYYQKSLKNLTEEA